MSMVETTTTDTGQAEGTQSEVTSNEGLEVTLPQTVRLTVNGVEIEKTLDEIAEGFMLKADYTRKTQTLAEQRKQLERAENLVKALNSNPKETLRMLAQELELDDLSLEYEDDDPANKRFQTLEQEIQTLRQREVEREIASEVGTLKSKYAVSDDDIQDIMVHATKKGIDLQAAYRDLYFDQAFEALSAVKARKAAEAEIDGTKALAGAIHLGVGSSSASNSTPRVERPKSFREAYALAKQGIRYEGA